MLVWTMDTTSPTVRTENQVTRHSIAKAVLNAEAIVFPQVDGQKDGSGATNVVSTFTEAGLCYSDYPNNISGRPTLAQHRATLAQQKMLLG